MIVGIIFILHSSHHVVSAMNVRKVEYAGSLDHYLLTQMDAYKIPGLAIAIVRDGKLEYQNGYGTANAEGDPVTPDTPFLLASVSKSFTALGVMQLVEAGKINLDDPLQKYLPWFAVADGRAERITVSHLLYHTSGFSELGGNKMNIRRDTPNGLEAGVRDLANERLSFDPGDGWEYSNINYDVLGLLIQDVSGQRYETYIQEYIFDPLGMDNSYTSLSDARTAKAASGYYPFFGIPLVFDSFMPYTSAVLPSAGLWSSASDLSRYIIVNLNDGQYESSRLLSSTNMERLLTPGVEIEPGYNYAMGWFHAPNFLDREFLKTLKTDLNQYEDIEVLWHEGDWSNYKSVVLMLPEQDYGVVILMNSNDPAVASVFRDFAWDVTLIATGGQAYYSQPHEDFIVRNARWIFSVLSLFLLGGLIWSVTRQKKSGNNKSSSLLALMFLMMNIAFLVYLHLKLMPDNAANIPILLKSNPDLGILALCVTLLSAGWSMVCLLMFIRASKKSH
jgi:CubicO group peptidase (beta-lactamase class C family)